MIFKLNFVKIDNLFQSSLWTCAHAHTHKLDDIRCHPKFSMKARENILWVLIPMSCLVKVSFRK